VEQEMDELTYQGMRIKHWHEAMDGEDVRVSLIVEDPRHPSGTRAIVLTRREAVALKMAHRSIIEAMPRVEDTA